ncbi:MAG: GWxTD domain-containing protein [Thermoanaerobaculia bacterium]
MWGSFRRAASVLALAAAAAAAADWPSSDSEDWADSSEAYFLTEEERAEWKALDSRDSRGAFRERYWLKRDPTPGTEPNEFREMVLGRIRTADQRFGIEDRIGSRTARGFVFIVFGSPARVRDRHATPPSNPRLPGSNVGGFEGNETLSLWIYDRDRTPEILEALELPSFEVQLILEPSRRSDAVQSPGLVKKMRERLARKSIVNPDLIAPARPPVVEPAVARLPRAILEPAVLSVLEKAPFSTRSGESVFGEAVLWGETGEAETLVWFYLPPAPGTGKRFLHGIVRKEEGGEEIASISEPVESSGAFSPADPGEVVLRRLQLPPGTYEAAFAVTEGSAARSVASASVRLSVSDLDSGFAVSSLLLTRGPAGRVPGEVSPFAIGRALLPPRADATFSRSESLWFFLELANSRQPEGVTLEMRLRRGTEPIAGRPPFPAQPERLAEGRYLSGFELPLGGLTPGDYRLYVLVRDGGAPAAEYVLRSADFRLRP